jgi:hypothetical protein
MKKHVNFLLMQIIFRELDLWPLLFEGTTPIFSRTLWCSIYIPNAKKLYLNILFTFT